MNILFGCFRNVIQGYQKYQRNEKTENKTSKKDDHLIIYTYWFTLDHDNNNNKNILLNFLYN